MIFGKRVPFIPQLEAADCGAAALAMILGGLGCHVSLEVARSACGVSRDGSTVLAIANAAETFGVKARSYRLELEDLRDLELPAILHWQLSHFVVLERASDKSLTIVDPSGGRRTITWDEASRGFSGVAMTFEPLPTFVKRPRKGSAIRLLSALVALGSGTFLLLTSMLALELAAMIFPAAMQIIVDHVIRPRQERWLWFVTIAYAVAIFVRFTLSLLRDRVVARMRAAVDTQIVARFVNHLARLPLGFFQLRGAGELMSRAGGTSAVRDIAMRAINGVFDMCLIAAYCVLMLAYDLKVGALLLTSAAIRVAIAIMARRAAAPHAAAELVAGGKEMATTIDAFSAPEAVKAFRLEGLLLRRYGRRLVERQNVAAVRKRLGFRFQTSFWFIDGIARAALYGYGGLSVMEGRISIGIFASFMAVELLLDTPLNAVLNTVQQLSVLREHLHRIDDVLEAKAEPTGEIDPGPIRGGITLDNVAFKYGAGSEDVVRNISLYIRPGEKVAFVGLSGSGKSTLARLITGTLDPSQGRVLIDGKDLRTLDRRKVRAQMGVVLQEGFVFDGSIVDNITVGRPGISPASAEHAAKLSGLDAIVARLEHGYDSNVAAAAFGLSGGERQRLSLTRALAHAPRIVVLDEATSSLDLASEARIQRSLQEIACTQVIIAHRLATVRDADRIFVLHEGTIQQIGTYDALAQAPGLFRVMVSTLEAQEAQHA